MSIDTTSKKTKRDVTPSEPMAKPIAPPPVQVEERIPPQKETIPTPMHSPPNVDLPKPAPTVPHWKDAMQEKRTQQKRAEKIVKLRQQAMTARSNVSKLEKELLKIELDARDTEPATTQQSTFQIKEQVPLPVPPAWTNAKQASTQRDQTMDLKHLVLNGLVPTAIADTGAKSNCGMEYVSECGQYKLAASPFRPTGQQSDKVFQYANGTMAAASEVKHLPMKLRPPANKMGTTIKGYKCGGTVQSIKRCSRYR